ncbi:unnamed protein product [Ectocarpus sp. 13 AM-2016]
MMQALAGPATPPVPAFASSPFGGVGQPGVGGLAGGGPFFSPILQLPQQQHQQHQQQQQEEQGSARAQPLPAVTTAMAPPFPFLQAAAVFPPPADWRPSRQEGGRTPCCRRCRLLSSAISTRRRASARRT